MSAFATFGGPPFEVFEIELLFEPMRRRIEETGGVLGATLGLSSVYHELCVLSVFKRLTRIKLGHPLEYFSIDSEYGKTKITEFCDDICR